MISRGSSESETAGSDFASDSVVLEKPADAVLLPETSEDFFGISDKIFEISISSTIFCSDVSDNSSFVCIGSGSIVSALIGSGLICSVSSSDISSGRPSISRFRSSGDKTVGFINSGI